MTNTTEVIVDDNGIELLVNYDWERSDSQIEEGHGEHEVGLNAYVELKSVEIVIAGEGFSFLGHLSKRQRLAIISKLNYNEG